MIVTSRPLTLAAAALGLAALPAHAAPFIYEGFNYGAVGKGINTQSVAGSGAIGLTGNYAINVNGTSASPPGLPQPTLNYVPTGLTFSTNFFTPTGGALQLDAGLATTNASHRFAVAAVRVSAGTVTGTVWTSSLFRLDASSINRTDETIGTRLNNDAGTNASNLTSSNNVSMRVDGIANNTVIPTPNASNVAGISYAGNNNSTAGSAALDVGTTYLLLSKFTNVGVSGGGTASFWALTATQYDNWISLGGGLESTLGTYATSTATDTKTTQININANTNMQFTLNTVGLHTGALGATFDERRFGVELTDVVVVPEPGSVALGVLGAALAFGGQRRRTR